LWLLMQTQPDVDELAELRDAVLQQIDTNRDGKIELGEFARYSVHAPAHDIRHVATASA